jgi:hypothetical protein
MPLRKNQPLNKSEANLAPYSEYNLCINGKRLSEKDKRQFFKKLECISASTAKFIYRGDNLTSVLRRFNLNALDIPRPFNDMLFLIGDKGKFFLQGIQKRMNSEGSYHIEDSSEAFFNSIFDMLNNLLCTSINSFNLQRKIDEFKNKEQLVVNFFCNEKNKKEFFKRISAAPNNELIIIRDYYLSLLHHINRSDYYPFSFLLSTTKNFNVAKRFVERHVNSHNEIIFAGWVPQNQRIIFTPFTTVGKQSTVEKYGLPTYKKSFFPYQEEVSLKGGLMPHFIIGYFYSNATEKFFELNPYFINNTKEDWVTDGLPVNQGAFWAKIKETQFRSAFVYDSQHGYLTV